jgi:hypothetical protein
VAGATTAGALQAGAAFLVLVQAEIPTATAIAANMTMIFFIDPPVTGFVDCKLQTCPVL